VNGGAVIKLGPATFIIWKLVALLPEHMASTVSAVTSGK